MLSVVKCSVCNDHSITTKEEMEKLWEYLLDIPKDEIKIIRCETGVGGTNTLIEFRVLKELKIVTIEYFS